MDWRHLIEAARLLAGQTGYLSPGRPRQVMLKKAVSIAYYALFHALCYSNANAIAGRSPGSPPYPLAWVRTYRALEHGPASQRMNRQAGNMSFALQDFGIVFSAMQAHRHRADYDPESRFLRSDVVNLISRTETAIETLFTVSPAERRTLAAIVLMRDR